MCKWCSYILLYYIKAMHKHKITYEWTQVECIDGSWWQGCRRKEYFNGCCTDHFNCVKTDCESVWHSIWSHLLQELMHICVVQFSAQRHPVTPCSCQQNVLCLLFNIFNCFWDSVVQVFHSFWILPSAIIEIRINFSTFEVHQKSNSSEKKWCKFIMG